MTHKIFINIAAYRDPLLVRTLRQAYEKADNKDALVFALAMQYEKEIYPDLSFIPNNQLRIINYEVGKQPGITRIRYELSKSAYNNEKYFLMIDSHMTFQESWDTWLIDSLNNLGSNSIISGLGEIHDNKINLNKCQIIQGNSDLVFERNNYSIDIDQSEIGKFFKTNYITCGFFFTYGTFLEEVGLDQYSQFDSEEPYLTWRAFMSGWDIYHTSHWVINHTPEIYYDYAWGGFKNRKFMRDGMESVFRNHLIMLKSLAYVYNDYSIYAIKNAKKSPIDWFLANGYTQSDYKKIVNHFDEMIRNNHKERAIIIL